MSVDTTEQPPRSSSLVDPFAIGWREVQVPGPDGVLDWERIPLTLEDALHPLEGDVMPEASIHEIILAYLVTVFRSRLSAPAMAVFSDLIVYWDHPSLGHHSPDVCIIPNIKKPLSAYKSFSEKEDKTRPTLIVEVVSLNTRVNDVETKLAEYHQAGVEHYVILDRLKEEGPWHLLDYHHEPAGYRLMPLGPQGRLWLKEVGVWLEVDGRDVRCIDPKTGAVIPDGPEAVEVVEREKARADQEKARADQEKARADRLAAELEKLKASLVKAGNGAPHSNGEKP